jgi:hypothetical protein
MYRQSGIARRELPGAGATYQWRRAAVLVLACALLLAGCQPAARAPSPTAPSPAPAPASATITSTDPCATRLHDLSGPLLLYYAMHRGLPEHLHDLSAMPGFEHLTDLTCPVSGLPYLYNPDGMIPPIPQGRVILADAAPSHAGMRWVIAVIEPADGGPLIARVVAVAEAAFAWMR